MIEQLALIVATAAVNAAVTLAVLKVELRHLRADNVRAHKRLDMIGAPNFTAEAER